MFRITEPKGFQMDLDNGYTISILIGSHSYTGHDGKTAEVAVMYPNGDFVRLDEYDDVIGWQTVSDVIAIINKYDALEGEANEQVGSKGCQEEEEERIQV